MRPEAREAWLEVSERIGNPSSLHASGRAARGLLEDARERIAAALGAHPTEVILTAGATEALNTAIEEIVDRVSPEISEMGKHSKDLGSFAVFCLITANAGYAAYVVISRLI